MSVSRQAARGVAWSALGEGSSRAFSLAVFAILGRILSPSDFGVVAVATVCVTFLETLVTLGTVDYIIQKKELSDRVLNTAFWANLGISGVVALAMVAAAGPFAQVMGMPRLVPVVRWLSLMLIAAGLSAVQRGIMQREFQYRALTLRTFAAAIVGGGAGIACALAGFNEMALVVQVLASQVVATVLLWAQSTWRPAFALSNKDVVSKHAFKDMLSFGSGIIGATAMGFGTRRADVLFVGAAFSPAAAGIYSIGKRVFQIVSSLVLRSSSAVVMSSLSKVKNQGGDVRAAYISAIQLCSLVSFPCFVGLAILAEPFVLSFFGDKWLASVAPMRLIVLAGLIVAPSDVNSRVFRSQGRTSFLVYLQAIQLTLYIPGLAVLYRFGLEAVAAAQLGVLVLAHAIEVRFVTRVIPITFRSYAAALLPVAVSTAIMAACVSGMQALLVSVGSLSPWITLAAGVAAGIASFVVATRIFAAPLFFAVARQIFARRLSQSAP